MSIRNALFISCCFLFSSWSSFAATTVRRYALAVGANYGGSDRTTLKYAVSDAESFARVMETLGGVYSSELILLNQPTLLELEDSLEELRSRLALSKDSIEEPGRTEVVVYVSGHANETGLLLGKEIFSYRSLRNWMDLVEADVRIAILDACASGAITRLKGSRRRSPFLVDASSDMRGHAFLTSSSADEVAQESDSIGRSFFTHYLVSGLRGAADTSGDGRVTLNEAYQFAFHETLGRTTETQAGTQHPSYDINLSGTGDVVMTDVRVTSAVLLLGEELSGRFFIRNSDEQLEVELYKLRGRNVELGLEPGTYKIFCHTESGNSVSVVDLKEEVRFALGPDQFTATKLEPVIVRGGIDPRFGALDGRWGLGITFGSWHSGGLGSADSGRVWDKHNLRIGGIASYWLSEKWALDFTTWIFPVHLVQERNITPDNTYIAAFLFGGRRYFPNLGGLSPSIKPFLAAAAGPYLRGGMAPDGSRVHNIAAGGKVGGGLDFQLARWCMVGTKVGYNFTSDFTRDFATYGSKTSYSGFELGIDFSFLLGKGSNQWE